VRRPTASSKKSKLALRRKSRPALLTSSASLTRKPQELRRRNLLKNATQT
jgi:hypothetical protein